METIDQIQEIQIKKKKWLNLKWVSMIKLR